MRWFVVAFVLSVLFTAFVVVAAVTSGPASSPDDYELHEPESEQEKAAARVAITYFRGLLDARPDAVCRTVTEPLTTAMRCATRPRIPRDRRVSADGHHRLRVTHIALHGATGFAWISGISPGPGQRVSLQRVGRAWRVAGNSACGLA
jgi:hypothetical protein